MKCSCCDHEGNVDNLVSGDLMDLVVFQSVLEKKRIDEIMIKVIFENLNLSKNIHRGGICFVCRNKVLNVIEKNNQSVVKLLKNVFKV